MTRPSWRLVLSLKLGLVGVAALICLAQPESALGQSVPEYDLIDLGELPGMSAGDIVQAVPEAINEKLIVAGHLAGSGVRVQGFVWSWSTPHSLLSRQMLGLRDMSGFISSQDGKAFGINNSDVIVGYHYIDDPDGAERPVLWPLSTFDPGTSTLGDEGLTPFVIHNGTYGLGINDQSPPVVVGVDLSHCSSLAFSWTDDTYEELPLAASGDFQHAVDISTPIGAAEPLIVGWGEDSCIGQPVCEQGYLGLLWSGFGEEATADVVANPLPLETTAVQLFAVNNAEERVGYYSIRESDCIDQAAIWEYDGTLTALAALSGGPFPTRANGINNATECGEVTVVGENTLDETGARWFRNSSDTWSAIDLNDTFAQPTTSWTYVVRRTLDVNDCGWIVAQATRASTSTIQFRAVVLRPHRGCPADLDDDGQVGQADMAILLGDWSAVVACWNWKADIDLDGDVDATDFANLFGAGEHVKLRTPSSRPARASKAPYRRVRKGKWMGL